MDHLKTQWARDLAKGAVRMFGFYQIDIAGHSNLPGADVDIAETREALRKSVLGLVSAHDGEELFWAGDGGSYLFLIDKGFEYDAMVSVGILILRTIPTLNEFTTLNRISHPIRLRMSFHCGHAHWDPDRSNLYSKCLNSFLKAEREIGRAGTLSISSEVYSQLRAADLKARFSKDLDHACKLGEDKYPSQIYVFSDSNTNPEFLGPSTSHLKPKITADIGKASINHDTYPATPRPPEKKGRALQESLEKLNAIAPPSVARRLQGLLDLFEHPAAFIESAVDILDFVIRRFHFQICSDYGPRTGQHFHDGDFLDVLPKLNLSETLIGGRTNEDSSATPSRDRSNRRSSAFADLYRFLEELTQEVGVFSQQANRLFPILRLADEPQNVSTVNPRRITDAESEMVSRALLELLIWLFQDYHAPHSWFLEGSKVSRQTTLSRLSDQHPGTPYLALLSSEAVDEDPQVIALGYAPILVGRDPSADVELKDQSASARQALFLRLENDVTLIDRSGRNTTWVNSVPVRQWALRPGEIIEFVGQKLVFGWTPGERPPRASRTSFDTVRRRFGVPKYESVETDDENLFFDSRAQALTRLGSTTDLLNTGDIGRIIDPHAWELLCVPESDDRSVRAFSIPRPSCLFGSNPACAVRLLPSARTKPFHALAKLGREGLRIHTLNSEADLLIQQRWCASGLVSSGERFQLLGEVYEANYAPDSWKMIRGAPYQPETDRYAVTVIAGPIYGAERDLPFKYTSPTFGDSPDCTVYIPLEESYDDTAPKGAVAQISEDVKYGLVLQRLSDRAAILNNDTSVRSGVVVRIRIGDIITIGSCRLLFHLSSMHQYWPLRNTETR